MIRRWLNIVLLEAIYNQEGGLEDSEVRVKDLLFLIFIFVVFIVLALLGFGATR